MSSEKARRRRGSSYFEDSSRTKRFTRQSLPCISFSGTTTLANPSLGTRQGIEMEPGVRSRRLSNLSFNLAGVSGNLVPAVETGAKAENAVETGAKDETPEVEYLFPLWWFVILALPGFLHSMVSNALWGVIWPALLAQMSGDKYKTLAFAAGGQICTVVGYSHPFIGSWSDRLPADHFIVRLFRGRRRPFIACGGFVASFGVWMTYDALYRIVERPQTCYGHDPAWSQIESRGQCVAAGGSWGAAPLPHTTVVLAYLELALSLVIGNSGAAIWTPPYNAIIAETVPLRQRGTCVMVTSWVNTVTGIFSGSIAYMVGEQLSCSFESPPAGFDVKDQQWEGACFTAKQIWWCDIWILIGQIPFYMLCCNGRACDGCSWNGIFKPEKEIKRPALDTSSTTDTRTRRQRWRDEWNGFTAAFTDPCYKWLWIQGFVGQIGGLISNQFQFYWYQDCFNQCTGCKNAVAGQALVQGACTVVKNVTKCTPHFYFFHWQVASTAVGATAFNKLISQILHILILPMIRPDYWRDRFGGRPLLIWTGFAGLGLIQPFIYAWLTGNEYLYTLIQMWSVWGTFLGVINTAAGGSLMMDCLPSDDEGRPLSASRDLAFHEWAGRIPETGLPLLMGASFMWFPSHTMAFKTFFCVGGAIGFCTNFIFIFLVHPKDEHLDKSFQCTRHWYWEEYDKRRRQGLAGPEMLALRDARAQSIADAAAQERREQRVAAGLPPQEHFEAPEGARCCDQLLFGKTWVGDVTAVYEGAYRTMLRGHHHQEKATAAEKAPLLSTNS